MKKLKHQTFHIIPGFSEGRWHMRQLVEELEAAGFEQTPLANDADIVITHSGGCYLLPTKTRDQIIVLIGPAYWPGKPLVLGLVQKLRGDFNNFSKQGKVSYWLKKNFWNFLYIWRDLLRAGTMSLRVWRHNFNEVLTENPIVIIRNQNDSWCSPNIGDYLDKSKKYSFHSLPGEHDDCWYNPTPYVQIIKQL